MDAMRCVSWWSIVVLGLGLGAACTSHQAKPVRYGSLTIDERSFHYAHDVETLRLQNGLLVALLPDQRANLVAVDVRYLVGDVEDPAGKRGLAHLVEHLMFAQRSAGGPTTSERLATIALRHNATTTWDATHYHSLALAAQLDELLAIEASRMADGCAGLDQAALDHERAVVALELVQRGPAGLIDALLGELYGAAHAYTRRATADDVAALTLPDVCGFIDAHYAPERAILVVTGRIDPPVVRAALATKFARIARRARGALPATARQPMIGTTRQLRLETDEPTAIVLVPAAPWGSAEAFDDRLVDGLLLLALEKLDHDQAWITDVEAGHVGGARDGARYFAVSVRDPARLDDAVAAVFRAASELSAQTSGLALAVLAARRRAELFDDFESIDERGAHCADYLQHTTDRQFHLRELAALQAIDTDRLSARAAYLTRSRSRVLRVLPERDVRHDALRQLHTASAASDGPSWQAPVDPAEADHPVALPAERRATAVSERRLANGMRLVMANDFTQPMVEARLIFPVGERTAGPDRAATAVAAAMLLDHDTSEGYSFKDYTIINWVMRLGAQLSAEVDDHTTFTVRGSSSFADWHLWRLHWLLEAGSYDADALARAREAAQRPAMRRDHSRSWRRALREAVLGTDHPDGAAPDVAAQLRADNLEAFRAAHYRISDATLIVVGKFDAAVMARTVTELFGAWPATAPAPAPRLPARPPPSGPVWIAHADPEASQVRITVSFSATSDQVATRGARAVAGVMVRERVAQIRTRLGASYGVDAAYVTLEPADAIVIDGRVDAGRAGEVLRRMRADLEGLHAGDDAVVTDFVRARRAALAAALGDPMKVRSVADELEAAVAHHRPIDDAATLPAAIAATTLAEVRGVLAADLAPARMVVLVSGRAADTAAALRGAEVTAFRSVGDDP